MSADRFSDTDIDVIRNSELFDTAWYLQTYPEVKLLGMDPVMHYLIFGARLNHNPCQQFDTARYLRQNPDVAEKNLNPLLHYITTGEQEHREISPVSQDEIFLIEESELFDAEWYLAQNPDVAALDIRPAMHYIHVGAAEGRDPSIDFSTQWYTDEYPDVLISGVNPLVHYLRFGKDEGRLIAPSAVKYVPYILESKLFDSDWYLANNPDIAGTGIDPALHYVYKGAAEGRDPGPEFNTQRYLRDYPDVAEKGMNPLVHYVLYGRQEGKKIAPSGRADAITTKLEVPAAASEPVSFPAVAGAEVPWTRQQQLGLMDGTAMLEFAGLFLGTAQTQGTEDDAWLACMEKLPALLLFCRLLGLEPQQFMRFYKDKSPCDISGRTADLQVPGSCPLLSVASARTGFEINDIWYVNNYELRVRLDRGGNENPCPGVVRFYTCDPDRENGFLLAAEAIVYGDSLDFADIPLANPFLPLLLSVSSTQGDLLSLSLIPFPSLCRGGVHYGELCEVGTEACYLDNLKAVSGSLLEQMLPGSVESGYSIARVNVDLQGAAGSERIFSPAIREWLAAVMQVRLACSNNATVPQPAVRTYLEESITVPRKALAEDKTGKIEEREKNGDFTLSIPADAVPSLHALAARTLTMPRDTRSVSCPFIVAGKESGQPLWSVSLPKMDSVLQELQPAGACISYPVLEQLPDRNNGTTAGSTGDFPFAVRFCETGIVNNAELLMHEPPDVPGPLLRLTGGKRKAAAEEITVLLPVTRGADGSAVAFLESLQNQTIANRVKIVITGNSSADGKAMMEEVLKPAFPDRYVLIDADTELNTCAGINLAAGRAEGGYYLVASESIILHDPRTLETLYMMAGRDSVASAGCMLVKEEGGKNRDAVVFHSGGIFPGYPLTGGSGYSEPCCYPVFPFATYPVAGNSSALFMVKSAIWHKLGGFDEANYPDTCFDIDYGLRAVAQGYYHLCTSAVSAWIHGKEIVDNIYTDVSLQGPQHGDGHRKLVSSATVLRRLSA